MNDRGLILTACGPNARAALYEHALPTFRRYADRWGLDVHVEDLDADGDGSDPAARAARWSKIPLLAYTLRSRPVVVWLDADVLICRDDDDILSHLHRTAFQAMALEQVPAEHRVNPNTGVWVMRSTPAAFAFLDAVQAVGPQPGPWADQGAVLVALGWHRGDERYHWARPGRGTPFLAATSWLPPSWNQPYLRRDDDAEQFNSPASSYHDRPTVAAPHALHFMGMRPAARYAHMAAVAQHLRPGVTELTA